MGATFCIAVILFVSAPWLIDWLYTDEFADAIPVLRIMSISLVFVAMSTAYGTNYLIVQGHERILIGGVCHCVPINHSLFLYWCGSDGHIFQNVLRYFFLAGSHEIEEKSFGK